MGKDGKSENRQQPGIRINKFLSEAGVCSRRAADAEIAAGNVKIGGRTATTGERVLPGDTVFFRGEPVVAEKAEIFLAFHKPRGIVCTAQKKENDNIIDYINYPKRIYPVGRLDKDSEGLILLTNQGDLVNRIMRAGNYHEKEYIVTVDHEITDEFLRGMRGGVYLPELDVTTRPCRVFLRGTDRGTPPGHAQKKSTHTFHIILTQGYNRQIRRMCEVFGYRVTRLVRVRIMNIWLGDLPVGQWRDVTAREKGELYTLIKDSYSAPPEARRRAKEKKASKRKVFHK